MIICSCNVITDDKIKEVIQNRQSRPSVGTVLKELQLPPVCGTCANTISKVIEEHYESLHRTV
jgi:bacterioferritin-associated ferredoxin